MSSQVIAMNLNLIMKREGEIVTTPSELAEEAEVTITSKMFPVLGLMAKNGT